MDEILAGKDMEAMAAKLKEMDHDPGATEKFLGDIFQEDEAALKELKHTGLSIEEDKIRKKEEEEKEKRRREMKGSFGDADEIEEEDLELEERRKKRDKRREKKKKMGVEKRNSKSEKEKARKSAKDKRFPKPKKKKHILHWSALNKEREIVGTAFAAEMKTSAAGMKPTGGVFAKQTAVSSIWHRKPPVCGVKDKGSEMKNHLLGTSLMDSGVGELDNEKEVRDPGGMEYQPPESIDPEAVLEDLEAGGNYQAGALLRDENWRRSKGLPPWKLIEKETPEEKKLRRANYMRADKDRLVKQAKSMKRSHIKAWENQQNENRKMGILPKKCAGVHFVDMDLRSGVVSGILTMDMGERLRWPTTAIGIREDLGAGNQRGERGRGVLIKWYDISCPCTDLNVSFFCSKFY
jgi:hypothetical protein